MATIRVDLTEEQMAKLRELADRVRASVEEMARLALQHAILGEEEGFLQAAGRVLGKNEELYRRLG